MARYIGPKSRIARRFGEAIFGEDKVLAKRPYAPGQHGVNRRKKNSEYGTQLAEKQKAKYTYGVLERQFRLLFAKAARTKVIITGFPPNSFTMFSYCTQNGARIITSSPGLIQAMNDR